MLPQSYPLGWKSRLRIFGSGLVAGLLSSLAISALILLVEKTTLLPVGTFYLLLVSATLHVQGYTTSAIALGFLMHLAAGTIMGLAISLPLAISKRILVTKFAPAYGLIVGVLLWTVLFLPITFGIMLPLLNSFDGQDVIKQGFPTGEIAITINRLLSLMDELIIGSLAFNMFYGLLVVIISKSLVESYFRKNQVII